MRVSYAHCMRTLRACTEDIHAHGGQSEAVRSEAAADGCPQAFQEPCDCMHLCTLECAIATLPRHWDRRLREQSAASRSGPFVCEMERRSSSSCGDARASLQKCSARARRLYSCSLSISTTRFAAVRNARASCAFLPLLEFRCFVSHVCEFGPLAHDARPHS